MSAEESDKPIRRWLLEQLGHELASEEPKKQDHETQDRVSQERENLERADRGEIH